MLLHCIFRAFCFITTRGCGIILCLAILTIMFFWLIFIGAILGFVEPATLFCISLPPNWLYIHPMELLVQRMSLANNNSGSSMPNHSGCHAAKHEIFLLLHGNEQYQNMTFFELGQHENFPIMINMHTMCIKRAFTGGGIVRLVMARFAWVGDLQFCFEVFVIAFCFVIVLMGATFIGCVRDSCFLLKGQRCGCVWTNLSNSSQAFLRAW